MREIHITLRPDRLERPLVSVSVGHLAAAVLIIDGDVPQDLESMAVEITRLPDATTTPPTPRPNFIQEAKRQPNGTYRAYINPYCFADESDDLQYHVVANDNGNNGLTINNPRWLGSGLLRVLPAPTDGSPVAPEILPHDTYVYNPVTKLYYKVIAVVDEYGTITLETDQHGVDL